MVASADELATAVGTRIFERGGNAVDAAIATNAVLAVTGPQLCGMGGDLFALVAVDGEVFALNSSGRAGSGADAAAMRAEGATGMSLRHDIRSVTVPGCVDGWLALHERFATLPLEDLLAAAREFAVDGFPSSQPLHDELRELGEQSAAQLHEMYGQATKPGSTITRPGLAATMDAIVASGRDGFYAGEFGEGLIEMGDGLFTTDDLAQSFATWVEPLTTTAFGVEIATIGPNCQGYIALGAARLAEQLDLPDRTDTTDWAHLLAEAVKAAGRDRPQQLFEGADGAAIVEEIAGRIDEIDPSRASTSVAPGADGDTTYLCTAGRRDDGSIMAVSLIQSNAAGFGSHLVEQRTGINLHNRGIGFNLREGHGAEFAPGRRPPHTLIPTLAMRDGKLLSVFGTMGGDAQPQILLQLIARLFHHGEDPGTAIRAARWALRGTNGFDTWNDPNDMLLAVEGHAPGQWVEELAAIGHRTELFEVNDSRFGHAHAIVVEPNGGFVGAADPRTIVGSCAGT